MLLFWTFYSSKNPKKDDSPQNVELNKMLKYSCFNNILYSIFMMK